jgi:biofilm protein TabA
MASKQQLTFKEASFMIFSDLTTWESETTVYPKAITRGLEYIRSTDLRALAPGKYEIEGQLMVAMIQEPTTKSWEQQRPESHQTYIDIQYLIEGEEIIKVAVLTPDAVISEEDFEARDVAFYEKTSVESSLHFLPGAFAVFYPSDIHRPCCSVQQDQPIKKVVIKIHRSLLDL